MPVIMMGSHVWNWPFVLQGPLCRATLFGPSGSFTLWSAPLSVRGGYASAVRVLQSAVPYSSFSQSCTKDMNVNHLFNREKHRKTHCSWSHFAPWPLHSIVIEKQVCDYLCRTPLCDHEQDCFRTNIYCCINTIKIRNIVHQYEQQHKLFSSARNFIDAWLGVCDDLGDYLQY